MDRNIYKSGFIALVLFFVAACSDDYREAHYAADPTIVSEKNLWETVRSIPELSTFAGLLEKYGYDKTLQQPESFTLFAPDNAALSGLDTSKINVANDLIENHMARFFIPASSRIKQTIPTLNRKRIPLQFVNDRFYFGTSPFSVPYQRIVASNGIVHVLSQVEPFFPNNWEYLGKDPALDSIRSYFYSQNKLTFIPEASVPGSIVDGKQTYLDSVFQNSNPLLSRLGYINREDSSYTMIVPDNGAWEAAYTRIKSYFVYRANPFFNADSMQRARTSYALVQDLIFSNTLQKAPHDSLVSTSGNVFFKPAYLFDGSTSVTTSNGKLYITSSLRIDPLDSWHQSLIVEAERTKGRENTLSTPYSERISAGTRSISGGRYLKLEPTTSTGNPTVTFEIPGVLSDYYDVYCVFLSNKVLNPAASGVKPFKVYFNLSYPDTDGKTTTLRSPLTGVVETQPAKIDTVLVAADHKFNYANAGEETANVTLRVISNVPRTETTIYSRELLIDCILLKPKKKL
ncbi:MAG: hypothetical protein BGP01_00790 [Paludibacter sp. 47-17]|nr:MAG: hypothetical protein BGP01_00790 [Paludibacter sp. 47-17]